MKRFWYYKLSKHAQDTPTWFWFSVVWFPKESPGYYSIQTTIFAFMVVTDSLTQFSRNVNDRWQHRNIIMWTQNRITAFTIAIKIYLDLTMYPTCTRKSTLTFFCEIYLTYFQCSTLHTLSKKQLLHSHNYP